MRPIAWVNLFPLLHGRHIGLFVLLDGVMVEWWLPGIQSAGPYHGDSCPRHG